MRILLINYEFPPLGGGAAPVCRDVVLGLAARGHQVDVVTMGYRGLPRRQQLHPHARLFRVRCLRTRQQVCAVPEMISFVLPALWTAMRLHRAKPYDLSLTFFIIPSGVVSLLLWQLTRLPYVISAHGSDIPGHNPSRFRLAHRLLRPVWNLIVRQSRHILVPSSTLAERLRRLAPDQPVTVFPNALDGWPALEIPRTGGILAASRLFDFKGFQYVIEAMARHAIATPFTIIGDGPYRAELEALARQRQVPVHFAGWLERSDPRYRRAFAEAQVFVFPSERESFGMVVLEALASGLPCLVAQGGAPAELAGPAARTVPPRDPDALGRELRRLLSDPDLRAELGRQALARARDFSWEALLPRLERILKNPIARHPA